MKTKKTFKVLVFGFNTDEVEQYDVLIRFRQIWNGSGYNFDKNEVHDRESLRNWVERVSRYYFWAKCEWEFLMAHWPFGSYKMREDIKKFFDENLHSVLREDLITLKKIWGNGSSDNIKKFKQAIEKFSDKYYRMNFDDYSDNFKFDNIITREMTKIDVHSQIMMNIDVIVDILMDEFNIQNK